MRKQCQLASVNTTMKRRNSDRVFSLVRQADTTQSLSKEPCVRIFIEPLFVIKDESKHKHSSTGETLT